MSISAISVPDVSASSPIDRQPFTLNLSDLDVVQQILASNYGDINVETPNYCRVGEEAAWSSASNAFRSNILTLKTPRMELDTTNLQEQNSLSPEATSPEHDGSPPKRKRKPRTEKRAACTGCRQQKLKCDAHLDPSNPCSRCKRLHLNCQVKAGFQRVQKSKITKHVDDDKHAHGHNTHHSPATSQASSHMSPPSRSESLGQRNMSISSTALGTDVTRSLVGSPDALSSMGIPGNSDAGSDLVSILASLNTNSVNTSTQPRTIEKIEISGNAINEIFELFFTHYHPALPILDPNLSPDEYYKQSAFRFWAIIVTGCRRYSRNPTLLSSLIKPVTDLAIKSIYSESQPILSIQGLLILCQWPFPTKTSYREITFLFAGSAVQMALQAGMHMPGLDQDFHRTKISAPDPQFVMKKANLWGWICTVSWTTHLMLGFPPVQNFDSMRYIKQSKKMRELCPPVLTLRYLLQRTIASATTAVLEFGISERTPSTENATANLIQTFETQIQDIENENGIPEDPSLTQLYCLCARIHIKALHLFCHEERPNMRNISHLFSLCCTYVSLVQSLDESRAIMSHCITYFFLTALLAGSCLLKCLKTPSVCESVNTAVGTEAFLNAISIIKKASLENDDLPGRTAGILSKLWTSEKAFRTPIGHPYWPLRIRSRLSMSVVFDCVWYYREEFTDQGNTYPVPESQQTSPAIAPQMLQGATPRSQASDPQNWESAVGTPVLMDNMFGTMQSAPPLMPAITEPFLDLGWATDLGSLPYNLPGNGVYGGYEDWNYIMGPMATGTM